MFLYCNFGINSFSLPLPPEGALFPDGGRGEELQSDSG